MGNTVKKKKAKLMVEMNLNNSTSFIDYGAKEVLTDFSSTNIDTLAMSRNADDYTLCDIFVLYKGRINLNKGSEYFHFVGGKFYKFNNVDITVWKKIRQQALTGNSVGRVVRKELTDIHNDYEVMVFND